MLALCIANVADEVHEVNRKLTSFVDDPEAVPDVIHVTHLCSPLASLSVAVPKVETQQTEARSHAGHEQLEPEQNDRGQCSGTNLH